MPVIDMTSVANTESAQPEEKIKVLYIDDEPHNLVSFKATFRQRFDVTTAASGHDALELLQQHPFEVIVTDQRMPEMTGVQFLESILDRYPEPIRILLTGYTDMQAVIDAVNKGKIAEYLEKPWDEARLEDVIRKSAALYRARRSALEHTEKVETQNDQLEFLLRQKLLS